MINNVTRPVTNEINTTGDIQTIKQRKFRRERPLLPSSVGQFQTCNVQGSRQLEPDPLEQQGALE